VDEPEPGTDRGREYIRDRAGRTSVGSSFDGAVVPPLQPASPSRSNAPHALVFRLAIISRKKFQYMRPLERQR